MENIIISVCPGFSAPFLKAYKNGCTTLELYTEKSTVYCKVYYDFSPEPLKLSGTYKNGNSLELILMPHRIELYSDGILLDEEWPAGSRIFLPDDPIETNCKISIKDYSSATKNEPSVTGTFQNASGWRPEENVYVGDCMPYTDSGRYHVLYLKDRHHHTSKWNLGAHQWEHISTKDFINWDIHPMAVAITDKAEASICTGSHIRRNKTHCLYYTVRTCDNSPAPICRSLSYDGYHFKKDKNFSFKLSDKYDRVSARDPKVILGKDGLYHMLLTTRLISEDKGCLAHLISQDMNQWTELNLPEHICDDNTEPECPDYIEYNGFYYLIYSLQGKAYYKYSSEPFGKWKTPSNPVVPCSSVPKGAVWNDKIIFTGFERLGGYAGTMTFKSATNTPKGELVFD